MYFNLASSLLNLDYFSQASYLALYTIFNLEGFVPVTFPVVAYLKSA